MALLVLSRQRVEASLWGTRHRVLWDVPGRDVPGQVCFRAFQ